MDKIQQIIDKFLKEEISLKEGEVLKKWIENDENNLKFFKNKIRDFNNTDKDSFDYKKGYQKFLSQIEVKKTRTIYFSQYLKYAASIAILISGVYFMNQSLKPKTKEINIVSEIVNNDKIDQIILTLGDGSTKNIEQEELSYLNSKTVEETLIFNEIKVPRGQVFKLVLSDSTTVWLNADTKLKYPKEFISKSKFRKVQLEGEAFFEVAHNRKQPFIVSTNGVDVEVLGTKFNVSSYNNDKVISTTLVEGSVKVIDSVNNNSIIIKPSFQASYNRLDSDINIVKVDTEIYTGWMQNKLIINGLKFPEILKKLERVYDVTFINTEKSLENEMYNGEFVNEDIETVLKTISLSTPFKYQIKEKNILLSK